MKASVVYPGRDKAPSDGSALIVAIWAIGLLTMLVVSMTFDAHVESRLTSYYRKRSKAECAVKSAREVAEMLMNEASEADPDAEMPDDADPRWYPYALSLAEGLAIRGLEVPVGDAMVFIDVVPEESRRNVNMLSDEDWERIFEVTGVPEELWPELIDSLGDWIDKDDTPRLDGGETDDYYATLETPYRAGNAPLDTVEELLLVKGFSRPIVYGGALDVETDEPIYVDGLVKLLTVYGDGKVNVNTATSQVLMTLPGVDEVVAGAIVEEREGLYSDEGEQENTAFENVGDFEARIPGLSSEAMTLVTTDAAIYRVAGRGEVGGVSYTIECTAEFTKGEFRVLRWREEE